MSRRIVPLILISLSILSSACSSQRTEPVSAEGDGSLPHAVNINAATSDELQKIPHIGPSLAEKIIAFREVNGPFRRAEQLMLIQGIGDKRFRKIRPLIRIE